MNGLMNLGMTHLKIGLIKISNMEIKVGNKYITNNHREVNSSLHYKSFTIIGVMRVQTLYWYELKFEHDPEITYKVSEVHFRKYVVEGLEPLSPYRNIKPHKI